jgi:hypothetical protein
LWEDIYATGADKKYIALPYIEFELIETHLRYPEEKKDQLISQQVVGNFADLIFQDPNSKDYINESDMEFWFEEPSNGWRQGLARFYYLEELPLHTVSWPKLAKIFDGAIRKSMNAYEEGEIISGFCESIHMHHGISIDFGCDFLGLVPMDHEEWERANINLPSAKLELLRPDFDRLSNKEKSPIFVCKVRRKLDNKYFRWPIELDVIEPAWLRQYVLAIGDYEPRLIASDEHLSKIDSREFARISGRKYNSPRGYSYRFEDYTDHNTWTQTQINRINEDNNKELRNNQSSTTTKMNSAYEKLVRKLDVLCTEPEDSFPNYQ